MYSISYVFSAIRYQKQLINNCYTTLSKLQLSSVSPNYKIILDKSNNELCNEFDHGSKLTIKSIQLTKAEYFKLADFGYSTTDELLLSSDQVDQLNTVKIVSIRLEDKTHYTTIPIGEIIYENQDLDCISRDSSPIYDTVTGFHLRFIINQQCKFINSTVNTLKIVSGNLYCEYLTESKSHSSDFVEGSSLEIKSLNDTTDYIMYTVTGDQKKSYLMEDADYCGFNAVLGYELITLDIGHAMVKDGYAEFSQVYTEKSFHITSDSIIFQANLSKDEALMKLARDFQENLRLKGINEVIYQYYMTVDGESYYFEQYVPFSEYDTVVPQYKLTCSDAVCLKVISQIPAATELLLKTYYVYLQDKEPFTMCGLYTTIFVPSIIQSLSVKLVSNNSLAIQFSFLEDDPFSAANVSFDINVYIYSEEALLSETTITTPGAEHFSLNVATKLDFNKFQHFKVVVDIFKDDKFVDENFVVIDFNADNNEQYDLIVVVAASLSVFVLTIVYFIVSNLLRKKGKGRKSRTTEIKETFDI